VSPGKPSDRVDWYILHSPCFGSLLMEYSCLFFISWPLIWHATQQCTCEPHCCLIPQSQVSSNAAVIVTGWRHIFMSVLTLFFKNHDTSDGVCHVTWGLSIERGRGVI
jgi:hypothetical protein